MEKEETGIIVIDVFWLPEEISPLFYKKKIIQINTRDGLPKAIELLEKNNIKEFSLVISDRYHIISQESIRNGFKNVKITGHKVVKSQKAEFLELNILSCALNKHY